VRRPAIAAASMALRDGRGPAHLRRAAPSRLRRYRGWGARSSARLGARSPHETRGQRRGGPGPLDRSSTALGPPSNFGPVDSAGLSSDLATILRPTPLGPPQLVLAGKSRAVDSIAPYTRASRPAGSTTAAACDGIAVEERIKRHRGLAEALVPEWGAGGSCGYCNCLRNNRPKCV
jgi:hypothetical protein